MLGEFKQAVFLQMGLLLFQLHALLPWDAVHCLMLGELMQAGGAVAQSM